MRLVSLQPGARTVLSGQESKAMTHYLRSRHAGILVGVGTAKADNPGLNSRYSEDGRNPVGLERQPLPFILDPSGRWNVEDTLKLFSLAQSGQGKPPSWIVSDGKIHGGALSKVQEAKGYVLGAGVYQGLEKGVDWDTVLRRLKNIGVESVMIEGGGRVIKDLLMGRNQKFISSVIVTIAPTYLGAGGVDVAPQRSIETQNEVKLRDVKWLPLGQDVVMAGFIK